MVHICILEIIETGEATRLFPKQKENMGSGSPHNTCIYESYAQYQYILSIANTIVELITVPTS